MSISTKQRNALKERSDGMCEVCGINTATNWHHRKNRSQGGGNELSNALHLCGSGTTGCHGHITANPAGSYFKGWSVRSGFNPAATAVFRLGVWAVLGDDGSVTAVTEQPDFYRQGLCVSCGAVPYSAGRPRCNECHLDHIDRLNKGMRKVGLPWVKLDTNFGTNPKILYLVEDKKHRAIVAYVCGLGYAGAQGTDGFIPAACLPMIHATRADAKALVDVGLWLESIGGWVINGWDEHQQSNEETQLRKQRAQKAAMARWHGPD